MYNFTVVSFYPWFLICTWTSTNHGSCSIVPSLLKKIICKWTCTVLTCILRGSVTMSFRSKELPCIASVTISSFPFSLYANLIVWILNVLYKCSSFLIISLPLYVLVVLFYFMGYFLNFVFQSKFWFFFFLLSYFKFISSFSVHVLIVSCFIVSVLSFLTIDFCFVLFSSATGIFCILWLCLFVCLFSHLPCKRLLSNV